MTHEQRTAWHAALIALALAALLYDRHADTIRAALASAWAKACGEPPAVEQAPLAAAQMPERDCPPGRGSGRW